MNQTNPLMELNKAGQSPWLDNIRRGMIRTGELARMIQDFCLRGVTSNPSIFEKAISGSTDYDEAILEFVSQRQGSPAELFDSLAIQDIQDTADIFLPVFKESRGGDGFVSIEVAPSLANDTQGTLAEARRLFRTVGRPNVMIKIPGTLEGLPAIEQAIYDGININITLLFSLARHEQVVEAYLKGLERRVREGRPIAGIASVASFFVSRVDTKVDKLLENASAKALQGKAAIANAKLAYQKYKEVFNSRRFKALQEKGARTQRLLWASTSAKNPAYRDVIYVEELVGPDTVNTMPQATLSAFKDHGRVRLSLEEEISGAKETLESLKKVGVDMDRVTRELEMEGVKLFADAYDALLKCVAEKQATLRVGAKA
jgi:transaldolase